MNFAISPEKSYEIEKNCPMKGAGEGGSKDDLRGHSSTYPSQIQDKQGKQAQF